MGLAADRLLAYGGRLLLEHSHCPTALIDEAGRLIEWNKSLDELRKLTPGCDSIPQLLASNSRPRFFKLSEQALAEHKAGPTILHFANGPTGLPISYRCQIVAIPDGQLIIMAEPVAPLDQQSAEQYMRVTNDLAITARSLQKTRYELEKKQRLLEEALERLAQLANIDELTQLMNRRSILHRLSEEVGRSKRYHSAVSILLIDIDHFKQINDRYGHPAGDQVLHACASLLQRSIRNTDHLGRYGGEEFLAVLPMTSVGAAADLAERLCRLVEREAFIIAATITFAITISIGVAELDPQHDTADLLVAHTDSALYQAKGQGRNRYARWNP
ncbi:MAG: GGDEF domain-containing protein [Chloroflexales bacterium]|nr:GGDEF domain-containing protein [Chloroflexales bacterium]